MGKISPEEAARGFKTFEGKMDGLIIGGMNTGLNRAAKLAVTTYMEGGSSRDPFVDPPNPPPGPLKIRSGNLRRKMKIVNASRRGNGEYVGGLANNAEYAAIHEFGGRTSAHFIEAREADTLAFIGRDGNLVFREVVFHPGSEIPARPFLSPALEDAVPVIENEIGISLVFGIEAIFK